MNHDARVHRRRGIWLGISLVLLAVAVVLVLTGTGLVRWLLLAGALCNVVAFWELRRVRPPAV